MSADTLTTSAILDCLRRDGVRKTALALRKPPVSSRLLQELADLPTPSSAQQFVAAYPLSPSHLLETLAQTAQDPEVFPFLATNPRTPPHLLSTFAAHENPEVRAHVATHPQLAARELLVLAADSDPAVRRAVATNPSLRLPHHATLITDASPSIRLRLSSQPALPAQVALVLAADASTVVRTHTIAATTADEELLLGWASSDEEDVQLALASRKNLPAAARALLLLSPHATVRRVARDLIEPDPVALLHFITAGEPDEHAWVAALPSLLAPLQRQLAQSDRALTRLALAANPALIPDIADYFVALADESVCVALATNPALSAEHVQSLAATRLPAVLTALAYRDDLYDELIPFLLEHSPDFLRHWAIQQKPATLTDPALARRLLADPLPTIRALPSPRIPGAAPISTISPAIPLPPSASPPSAIRPLPTTSSRNSSSTPPPKSPSPRPPPKPPAPPPSQTRNPASPIPPSPPHPFLLLSDPISQLSTLSSQLAPAPRARISSPPLSTNSNASSGNKPPWPKKPPP